MRQSERTFASGPTESESRVIETTEVSLEGLAGQLLESAPDAVVIIGSDGVIRFANAQTEKLFGYAHDELVGELVEVLVPEHAKEFHTSERSTYFLNPTKRHMGAGLQLMGQHKDETRFPVDIALSSLVTGGGVLVSAAIRDVTERLEAGATGARLAAIVQSSVDAIIGKTAAGVITSWNPAASRMFGWSASEAIGKRIDFLIPSHRLEEETILHERVAAGELIEPYETERVGKTGRVVLVALTSSPIKTPYGEMVGVSSLYRDIGALKKVEAKFLGLLEAAPDAIIGVDQDGLIQLVTATAERLFGYSRDVLLGRPVVMLIPKWAQAIHDRHPSNYFAHPRARPVPAGMELCAVRQDGSEFPVDVALSAVDTEEGVIVSAAVRDITQSIRAAEERKQLEAQLRQSRLESIGQLAGGIAHDFNNILAGTMTYAKLIEEQLNATGAETFSDSKQVLIEDVQQIIRATERAAALTRQLLLFSRKEVVQTEVLDLNGVVGGVEDMLRRTVDESISLSINLRKPLKSIDMDRGHVEQILVNLVVNARDAMSSGGELLIETSLVELDEEYTRTRGSLMPGEYVCLVVSDTGEGMSDEVIARAFEPFFTTKERGEGSGLGLATIYGIVTQAQGHVAIYSEVGMGTTVKVLFPPTAAAMASVSEMSQVSLDSLEGETVLLVEDEAVVRESTARVLAKHGYDTIVAASPEEALELSNDPGRAIDVLLTDVVMPEMSGIALAEKLASSRPDLRVIFMSGYSHDLVVRHGASAEGIVLIEKPFTTEVLLGKIRFVLDRADRRSA
jgi:two-component system, cell cycle sensor histidine kinase and response regulator CckA